MKKTIVFSLLAFTMLQANAQSAAAPAGSKAVAVVAPPETLALKETEFNFGKIPQGKPVTHVFEIINTGKDSLKIVNVQASCGCTTPEWDRDKPIPAGGSAKITVGYNAANDGAFVKPVTITYNGTQTKQLFIKGEVWKTPATSAPENKSLNDLKN
jgi:Protein of unknown function (DUF1573)